MPTITDKQYLDRLQAAILLRQQGYYDQAEEIALDLVRFRPDESSLWHQMGQIHTARGNASLAVYGFGRALDLLRSKGALATHASQFQATSLGYAQSLMRLGRFAEAWPYFEAGRLHVSWSPWPATEYWDGMAESIPSLLVQAEGGYGDIFMFMRWLPLLKTVKGVGRVGLMIFKDLADFCDWSALGVDEVYRTGVDKIPFGRWQYSTSIMSLGAAFGMSGWEDRPDHLYDVVTFPYMHGDLTLRDPSVFKLGLCWRAEENSSPIKTKSLDMETASEVVRLLRAHTPDERPLILCSLSPEKKDLYNTEPFTQPDGLVYEPACMESWRATAVYLCSMDLVLSVDTAVAHLCGLLGVPCMTLVPKGGCWRFGLQDRTAHPWYGPEQKLYRQPDVLKWDPAHIVESLMKEIELATA
jgi:hypothetical protein